jgi:hypothetical protein
MHTHSDELVRLSPCGLVGDRPREQLLHLDDQTCAFPLEGQDWCEYDAGALRQATTVTMTLTHQGCMVDSTMELPPTPDQGVDHDRMRTGSVLLSGPAGCLVQRTNKLIVGGVQLAGRTLEASRTDPWHINPIDDNGHALSVVWVQQPEGSTPGQVGSSVREFIVSMNRCATTAATCHRGWGHAMG